MGLTIMIANIIVDTTKEHTRVPMDVATIEAAHRFHVYCARFPSDIPIQAIQEYSKPGQTVFDPFCGSGTTLVAGLLLGRRVWGSDIDELAGLLSWTKTHPDDERSYKAFSDRSLKMLYETFESITPYMHDAALNAAGAEEFRVNGYCLSLPKKFPLTYWFPPKAVVGLAVIARFASRFRRKTFRAAAELAFSASIISKWPNTLSYAMDIDHTRPHRKIRRIEFSKIFSMYSGRLDRVLSSLTALRHRYDELGISKRLDRLAAVSAMDARKLNRLSDESVHLIVTSPPYFDAVDYPRSHRFSLCWLNRPVASYSRYIGLHWNSKLNVDEWLSDRPALKRILPEHVGAAPRKRIKWITFFEDMRHSLQEMHRVLVPGGTAVCVIADNQAGGLSVAAHQAVIQLGRECGFNLIHASKRAIEPRKRRFPAGPFGFDGPMRHEHVLVLRRPPRATLRKSKG